MCPIFHLIPPYELPLRGSPNPPTLPTPTPNNTLMHSRLDTIIHFQVKFGQRILLVSRGFFDITEGGSIDDVTYDETFDCLILGDGFAGGGAPIFLVCDDMTMSDVKRECHKMKRQKLPDTLDVTTPMLISSVIASFDRHDGLSDCDC